MKKPILARWKPWQILLLFGILQCGITALGVYFFDYYAGSATAGFARMGQVFGTGMFFVYMLGYLNALIVLLPVQRLGFFGAAALVYLPYALVGLPTEYYYEYWLNPALKGLWAVVAWCAVGPAAGLAADLAHRFLPRVLPAGLRAALTGLALGAASYSLTLLALATFYKVPLDTGPGSFAGQTYFGLPWLLVHSALGGFTAWALARRPAAPSP